MPRGLMAAALIGACVSSAADSPWINDDHFDTLHVVLHDGAADIESVAARRFRARWTRFSGVEPTLSNRAKPGAVNVWVGEAARRAFPHWTARYKLTSDGFAVRTLEEANGKHLLLLGGGPRGVLYAEWAFFQRAIGVTAVGGLGIVWPETKPVDIPWIDIQHEPPFAHRDTNFRVYLEQPWLSSLNQLNGQWTALPQELGGHIGFVHDLAGYGHTFHDFVNPEEYFDTHPEYFAEISGERVKWSQLCLTNPEVLAITVQRAREFLRNAAPNERILSVSQEDYPEFESWCTCPRCRAVDLAEGSHSGTVIRFVNAVAEAIGDEFPDVLIDTFAYMHTRAPPRRTRPRDNVLVRVCAIEADYARPLADRRSARNREFMDDLRRWRRIARHVWVWDYTQNWWAFAAPHPNEHVLQPNLATFERLGLDGVFEQASPYASNSDLETLKAYLVGRGLREPGFNADDAYADVLDLYYGPAAPYIEEYRRLLRVRVIESGIPLRFYNDLDWIDARTVERAQEIFARAFASAPGAPYAQRVAEAFVSVQFAALVCPPRVYRTPDVYIFTRPPSQALDEYLAMLESRGVTYLNDYPLEALRLQLPEGTPPRYEVAPIERLVNGRFEVWIVPARSGAVVRWRERTTGRDWLRGFDDIRAAAGRIQDWADVGPHPMAEPRPVDRRYRVTERAGDTIVLEVELENGLRVTRRMTLDASGLLVAVELFNTSNEPIVPKFGLGAEFSDKELPRPSVWLETGRGWVRGRWNRDAWTGLREWETEPGVDRFGLRYAGAARTVAVDTASNAAVRTRVTRAAGGETVTMVSAFTRATLAPGASRRMSVRYAIVEEPPRRLD